MPRWVPAHTDCVCTDTPVYQSVASQKPFFQLSSRLWQRDKKVVVCYNRRTCAHAHHACNVQEVVSAHESMVSKLLESITPSQDAVRLETVAIAICADAHANADGQRKAGGQVAQGAVAALQFKVAMVILAENLISSEYQDAACGRYVPACIGCTHHSAVFEPCSYTTCSRAPGFTLTV